MYSFYSFYIGIITMNTQIDIMANADLKDVSSVPGGAALVLE